MHTRNFIEYILEKNILGAKECLQRIVENKVTESLDLKKVELSKSFPHIKHEKT